MTTQAEQDAEDDNINFLRTELPEEEERPVHDIAGESRRRMRRAMDAMVEPRVYTPAQLQELGELQEATDADRRTQQQYHGWAPGTSDDEEQTYTERSERRGASQSSTTLMDEHAMRPEQYRQHISRLRRLRDAAHTEWRDPTPSDPTAQPPSPWDQPRLMEHRNDDLPVMTESSLRTTALLQAVRRNPQFSARSRNELQRYILDRERGDDRDQARPARTNEPSNPVLSPSQRRQMQRENPIIQEIQQHQILLAERQLHHDNLAELRERENRLIPPSENRRRRYWQNPSAGMEKSRVDDVITYLGRLKLCESDQEGQETAEDGGFVPEGYSPAHPHDFLVNSRLVPPPPPSSWLRVGGVLSGTQHGACPYALPSYTPLMPPSLYRTRTRNHHFGSLPPRNTSPTRQPLETNSESPPPLEEERWPVKVTIHSVDYDEMTLTGTMEAFNVPDKSSPSKVSSITTYLEGEIIDFNTFSLETKSFKADTRVDGMYWRKLPPFKDMSDDEAMVKKLLSTGWLRGELMQKWILMRWKGSLMIFAHMEQHLLTMLSREMLCHTF